MLNKGNTGIPVEKMKLIDTAFETGSKCACAFDDIYRSARNRKYALLKIASIPLPPTAQKPGSNWLIFWLKTPRGNTFRGTEAIFEFHPRS